MIGSGEVIAHRLRRVFPQKNRTGIADVIQRCEWIGRKYFQMLRCDLIDHLDALGHIVHQDDARGSLKGGPDDLLAR